MVSCCFNLFLRLLDSINIFFAFSYVQHKIQTHSDVIKKALVADKGTVLVAGNSKNMPKAVLEAIKEAVGDDDYIEHMFKTKRYQEETWN